jgi:thioredoxin 1
MADASVLNLTTDTFDAEIGSASAPVLVDFWSEYCGPCKMLAPVLDELATELGDAAVIAKVDVMAERDLAMKYGVRAVPTLLFLKDGEVKETKVGMMSKGDILAKLQSLA